MNQQLFLKLKNIAFTVIYFFSIASVYYIFIKKSYRLIQPSLILSSNSYLGLMISLSTIYIWNDIFNCLFNMDDDKISKCIY